MGYNCFIDERDLMLSEGGTIPVYQGCNQLECQCGKCKTPIGYIDRDKVLTFLANQKHFSTWLEENVVKV